MKYPIIIFIRHDNYSSIDTVLDKNALECSITISNNEDDYKLLYGDKYHLLVTYGSDKSEYNIILNNIPERLRKRWLHESNISDINVFNEKVNHSYISNVIENREKTRPIFSVFTTCYKSFEKINRAYKSLLNQTFNDWEWVIMDDTPRENESHFYYLREILTDKRIRLYKRSDNSGVIGNVKNEVVSLCRGKYCFELDHDDEITPNCIQDAYECFKAHSDVGFIYMDFINMKEDGTPLKYGNFISKGYAGYYAMKYNGKWQNVYLTPNINNITLSHLVCCPNHPRIWERQFLLDIGNYSEMLPICDDYELLLRTCTNTKVAKICKLGYIQYMNDNENNFSLIRSSEINRIGPQHIMPQYYEKYFVHSDMSFKGAAENKNYIDECSQIWKRSDYEHCYINYRFSPDYDKQLLIIGAERIRLDDVNQYIDDLLCEVFLFDSENNLQNLINVVEELNYDKVRCWSLEDGNEKEIINYFNLSCKSCDYTIILK